MANGVEGQPEERVFIPAHGHQVQQALVRHFVYVVSLAFVRQLRPEGRLLFVHHSMDDLCHRQEIALRSVNIRLVVSVTGNSQRSPGGICHRQQATFAWWYLSQATFAWWYLSQATVNVRLVISVTGNSQRSPGGICHRQQSTFAWWYLSQATVNGRLVVSVTGNSQRSPGGICHRQQATFAWR